MKIGISTFYRVVLMYAFCLCFASAFAAEALLPPQEVIHKTSEQLRASIGQVSYEGDLAESMRIVEEVLSPHVDQSRVSALALGKHWRTATPEQRAHFQKEFKEMMVRTYALAYSSYKSGWSIRFLPLRMKPDAKKTLVDIELLRSAGNPVAISYRMVNRDNTWKVYDIIIEGVSLVTNYRNTFNDKIQQTGSVQGLIDHLAEKNRASRERHKSA